MQTASELELRVQIIIGQELGIDLKSDALGPETPLEDLAGIDSAALLQMLMAIEEEFGIEIDESEVTLDDLKNVRTIAALVLQNS